MHLVPCGCPVAPRARLEAAAQPLLLSPQRQLSRHVCRSQHNASASKRRSLENDLSELQQLAAGSTPSSKRRPSSPHDAAALLARVASKTGKMSVRQLCRLAFILTRLQGTSGGNVKPVWQSVLRRILAASEAQQQQHEHEHEHEQVTPPAAALQDPSTSTDPSAGADHTARMVSSLEALLCAEASAGDTLYLLRAVAAWQGGATQDTTTITRAAVAAASRSAAAISLQELMLSVTALAQLRYFDQHLLCTASQAFAAAVAASRSRGEVGGSSSKKGGGTQPANLQQQQQPERQQELLPHIRDHKLIVNFLWANASLGFSGDAAAAAADSNAQPLLLQAALQLMLTRQSLLLHSIGRSHLPLCMWALAALLVCQLYYRERQASTQEGKQEGQQQQQQQQELLVQVVQAVHGMLAARAAAVVQAHNVSGGKHGAATSRTAFSVDSRRQIHQAHVWLQAATASRAGDSSSVGAAQDSPGQLLEGLSSLEQLLVAAQEAQLQQQQQQQQQAGQLADFWQDCEAAWLNNSTQVSGLQRQVFQALQAAGFQPQLECAAQPPAQQGFSRQEGSEPGFLSVDIACRLPEGFVRLAQQQGLKAALAARMLQQQEHGGQLDEGSSSDSSSSLVLVAVEVDGPTHVAVDCQHHALGATVCRNWLLQQWGWTVLVVPWWEWQQQVAS